MAVFINIFIILQIQNIKKYKSNPYCREIIFSLKIKDCLTRDIKYSCNPFTFCLTGSKTSYIKIFLCNVPLFIKRN